MSGCYSVLHNAPDCIEAGVQPEEMCSTCLVDWKIANGRETIVTDRTEAVGQTYRWVDAARHEAEVIGASAWDFEEYRPAMAVNFRAAAEVFASLAEAVEKGEVDGKGAIAALLARIPQGSDLILMAAHG